jgi:hypothetical protein
LVNQDRPQAEHPPEGQAQHDVPPIINQERQLLHVDQPRMSANLHNKMDDTISHMTMMVIVPFSMIKMDAGTMTTTTATSFTIYMITTGR